MSVPYEQQASSGLQQLGLSVAEQQLDLLKFPTRGPAQLRAGAAKIVGRDPRNTSRRRVPLK